MAELNKGPEERGVRVRIRTVLLDSQEAEAKPNAAAYAFSPGGHFLARQPLDAQGNATLRVPAGEEATSVRILIGPETEEKAPSLTSLLRRGARERHLRIDPGGRDLELEFRILPDIWLCWLRGLCFVQGTLLKRVRSGGLDLDFPVCNATVEIYEVDPIHYILPRLPDSVLERFRGILLNPPRPPRPPLPDPPPFGSFPPFPPSDSPLEPPFPRFEMESTAARFLKGTSQSPQRRASSGMGAESSLSPIASGSASAPVLPPEFQFAVRNAGLTQLRSLLADWADLIRPIICLYFPHLLTKQRIATAETDDCGHFHTFFFRGCNNPDQPDLYFRATQRFFGLFDITIYAPTPVACHTHWDYDCGTEVTLITRHPLALTCPPCPPVIAPENWVLVMAVGNYPLSRIRGTGETLQSTTDATTIGLTETNAPWGGLLRPRIEFDNRLRDNLGVRYYQVSWRKGFSGNFTPLTGDVRRHYAHFVNGDLELTPYPLGPQTVNGVPNLFEIPPAVPPVGQWSTPDVIEDTSSAKFPTVDLAPAAEHGKYQIKVDLFDGSGAPVDLAATGILFVVPTSTDLSGTVETVAASTLGLVSGNSFVMTLHIDNNPCNPALIDAPTLNGNPANDNCGVLEYGTSNSGAVVLGWKASHPNGVSAQGFASFSFSLFRGVNLLSIPPATPTLPASGPALIGAGAFSDSQSVADLLGGCAIAGFSENLYVAAAAVDGWRRLSEYDTSAVRAFVLAPQPPPSIGP